MNIRNRITQFVASNPLGTFISKLFFTNGPRLAGRSSAGGGTGEEIAIGDGLTLVDGVLSADASGSVDWNTGIDNKPTTFPPTIGSGADESVAGNDARLSGPLELDAAPVNGAAESITSSTTLTEASGSTTCPTLYRQVDLVNGKPRYLSEGYVEAEFPLGAFGWQCYYNGSDWVVEYTGSGGFTYYFSGSTEDVATPDLVIAWNNTVGMGAPEFSLAPSIAGTAADYLGQDAIINEESFYKNIRLSPVKWVGPFPA